MREKVTADDLGFSMLRGHGSARLTVAQTAFLLDVARREGFTFEDFAIDFPIRGVPYSLYRYPNKAGTLQPSLSIRAAMAPGLHSFEEVAAFYPKLQEQWEDKMRSEEQSRAWVAEYHRVFNEQGRGAAQEWVTAHAGV